MSDSYYPNKDGVASFSWPDPHWAVGGYPYHQHLSVPQSTHPELISAPGYASNVGWPGSYHVPDLNATNDGTFSLAPTIEMGAFANLPTQVDFTNPPVPNPWLVQALSILNAESTVSQPQLVDNLHWPGIAPLATDLAAATPDSGVSPTSSTLTSQDTWGWPSDLLQAPGTTPASPAGRDASEFYWPDPAASGHVASNLAATYPPTMALGKRHREAEKPQGDGGLVGINTQNMPPQKRARGRTSEILEAERFTARTRRSLVARIPEIRIDGTPEEAGRGAGRLATPNAHGIYHQSSLGPSLFQQGCAMEPADRKPTWTEGSVDEEAAHCIDGMERQQQEEAAELFEIPRTFKPGDMYRLLLQASEADFAHGAVQAIKCRLCPDTNLKDFEEFKRHCKTSERHPFVIHFCDNCGDFFARSDSLRRHENRPPAECGKVTPVEAAEKRGVTEGEHKAFIWRLWHSLVTGEDIGKGFSQTIKERYPKSSKKRTGGSK